MSAVLKIFGAVAVTWAGLWSASVQADTPSFIDDLTAPQKAQLQMVPEAARYLYEGIWTATDLFPAPSVTPKKGPWQLCYNESYTGNTWRADVLAELQDGEKQFAAAGLSKGPLISTNSNGNLSVQLSQLNSLVAQGCDVIFSEPGSPTGLCSAIKNAVSHGIFVITVNNIARCPDAINVGNNGYLSAKITAEWLVKTMGGKGNLLEVEGMAGVGPTVAELDLFKRLAKENPELKIAGVVYGQWTGSVAKSETLKFLATHPQKVDGVWSAGLMAVAAEQALIQSGRDPVPFTDSGNECSLIAFRHEHGDIPSMSMVNGGGPNAYLGLLVASRLLAGQKLVVNTIVQPQPEITGQNISQYFKPEMTVQSTCWADPADKRFVADSYFDQFFTGGQPPVLDLKP